MFSFLVTSLKKMYLLDCSWRVARHSPTAAAVAVAELVLVGLFVLTAHNVAAVAADLDC